MLLIFPLKFLNDFSHFVLLNSNKNVVNIIYIYLIGSVLSCLYIHCIKIWNLVLHSLGWKREGIN
jgi:hypothetical protein